MVFAKSGNGLGISGSDFETQKIFKALLFLNANAANSANSANFSGRFASFVPFALRIITSTLTTTQNLFRLILANLR